MNEDVAVSIKNVSKEFMLPHEKSTTIKSVFTSAFKGKHSKTYERQQALRDITFEIKKGEFFGIVGRNGSGKSTLLKIIAGIYQPTKGGVTVNGKLVPFIELGVGFNPELTGRENVYLNGAILGFTKKEVDKNYKEIVEFAELEEHMDQKLKNYSSGMQVRLAFACATKSDAEILLVDEVLAVGDTDFQRKCFLYFRELKRSKKTVVFISHDLSAIEEFCDKVALIDDCRISYIGSPIEAAMRYRDVVVEHTENRTAEDLEHSGSGEIKITSFKVCQKGKKIKYISEDEGFDVEINYTAYKEVMNPVFGLAIVNAGDTVVAGPHTKEAGLTMGRVAGTGRLTVSFKGGVLSSGNYTFMTSCFDEDLTKPYDFIYNAAQLEVVGEQRYGAVILKPEWSIKK